MRPCVEAQQHLRLLGGGKEGDGPIKLKALCRISCECVRDTASDPRRTLICAYSKAQNTLHNIHICNNLNLYSKEVYS